jgi:hypothetical protein
MKISITVGNRTDEFDLAEDVISVDNERFSAKREGWQQSADEHILNSVHRLIRLHFWENYWKDILEK